MTAVRQVALKAARLFGVSPVTDGLAEWESALSDGTRVLFRRIRPDDKDRLRAGLEQLSAQSRYRRFFRYIDHFSDSELAYLTEVDFVDHWAWIATLPDALGEPGVAVGRWIRIADEPTVAEAAVTVVDAHQGEGLGKTMLWLLARSAIERGVSALRAWVLGDNEWMLTLLRDTGAPAGTWEAGVLEVDIPLPADPDDLYETPAPLVLKAVASGEIDAEARPHGGRGTTLRPPESDVGQTGPRRPRRAGE